MVQHQVSSQTVTAKGPPNQVSKSCPRVSKKPPTSLTVDFFDSIDQQATHAAQQNCCYSITSSARSRIDGGTVMPSSDAVFRFSTNSNLVGVSIGVSATLAPRRIFAAMTPIWRKMESKFGP